MVASRCRQKLSDNASVPLTQPVVARRQRCKKGTRQGLPAQHSSLSSSAVSWLPAAMYPKALAGVQYYNSRRNPACLQGLVGPHQLCSMWSRAAPFNQSSWLCQTCSFLHLLPAASPHRWAALRSGSKQHNCRRLGLPLVGFMFPACCRCAAAGAVQNMSSMGTSNLGELTLAASMHAVSVQQLI